MIWKYLIIFFIAIQLVFLQFAKAQQIDIEVWKTIYKDIKQQNAYYLLQSKFEGVIMVIDPIDGKCAFQYNELVDYETKKLFESYTFQEQVEIMKARYFSLDTLSTLLIVDTTQTFQETTYPIDSTQKLILQHNIPKISAPNYWRVFAIDDKSENIIVCFINMNVSGVYYCYYLSQTGSKWNIRKRNVGIQYEREYE